MFTGAWKMLKETVLSFIDDEALSRGAAIAFYTVTSIAPVLLIVVAIAGLAFGHDAAQNAIITQLSGLMGQQNRRSHPGGDSQRREEVIGDPCHYNWGRNIGRDCVRRVRRDAIFFECNLES